ncbi:YcxB family protein [Streptacidiphilus melanogenes]|uniref:YcxB family protein n=1 Tax=Streptacidiphilus melanogenes TaxID=411235 RepID=UPI0005A77BDB|nr:YcxB family protein [Streptacidiphilus melanogenes]
MDIETDYTYRPGEFRRGKLSTRSARFRALPCAAVLIGLSFVPVKGFPPVVFQVAGASALLLFLTVELSLRAQLARAQKAMGDARTLRLTDEMLTVSTPGRSATLRWDVLTGVKRTGGFWHFHETPASSVPVPERAFSERQAQELQAFLAARHLLRH